VRDRERRSGKDKKWKKDEGLYPAVHHKFLESPFENIRVITG